MALYLQGPYKQLQVAALAGITFHVAKVDLSCEVNHIRLNHVQLAKRQHK